MQGGAQADLRNRLLHHRVGLKVGAEARDMRVEQLAQHLPQLVPVARYRCHVAVRRRDPMLHPAASKLAGEDGAAALQLHGCAVDQV